MQLLAAGWDAARGGKQESVEGVELLAAVAAAASLPAAVTAAAALPAALLLVACLLSAAAAVGQRSCTSTATSVSRGNRVEPRRCTACSGPAALSQASTSDSRWACHVAAEPPGPEPWLGAVIGTGVGAPGPPWLSGAACGPPTRAPGWSCWCESEEVRSLAVGAGLAGPNRLSWLWPACPARAPVMSPLWTPTCPSLALGGRPP
jgi:hypothetical protein